MFVLSKMAFIELLFGELILMHVIVELVVLLLNPVVIAFLVLFISFFLNKKVYRVIGMIVSVAIMLLFSTGIITSSLLSGLGSYKPVTSQDIKDNRALILLGGGVTKNCFPSTFAYSRIYEAFRIYKIAETLGIKYKIIITGGRVNNISCSESEVYSDVLVSMGIPSKNIIIEKKSSNTEENAVFVNKLVKKLPYKHYLLVTNNIFMKRSLIIFRKMSLIVNPAISDQLKAKKTWKLGYNLLLNDIAIHEYLGILRIMMTYK